MLKNKRDPNDFTLFAFYLNVVRLDNRWAFSQKPHHHFSLFSSYSNVPCSQRLLTTTCTHTGNLVDEYKRHNGKEEKTKKKNLEEITKGKIYDKNKARDARHDVEKANDDLQLVRTGCWLSWPRANLNTPTSYLHMSTRMRAIIFMCVLHLSLIAPCPGNFI